MISEINTIIDLKKFIKNSNFKKIFLISGQKSFQNSNLKETIKNLEKKYEVKYYFKTNYLPNFQELIEIMIQLRKFKPDLILAVGGGSVIDYAKIANSVEPVEELKNHIINYSYPFKKKYTKLLVVPTTAGSGAEVTSNSVIYLDNIKYSLENDLLKPDFYFLIPELIIKCPYKIKSSSGFDALAQALESIISIKSNDESLNYAKKSIELTDKYYINFVEKPNFENATQMLISSNLAGKAIDITKTTAPHAVSYPFSNLFKLSHGHAVSLFFEDFFKFNYNNLKQSQTKFNLAERFEIIFKSLKVNNIEEFIIKIKKIKNKAGLDDNFKKMKIDISSHLENILKGINILRLKNNPIVLSEKKIVDIIKSK